MSYSILFSGEEQWLALDAVPGWILPYMQVLDVVPLEVQGPLDPLESPAVNLVPYPDHVIGTAWAVENGWSAFAVMLQYIGELLSPGGDNKMQVEQQVVRDPNTWDVKSSHYMVHWKGDDVEC